MAPHEARSASSRRGPGTDLMIVRRTARGALRRDRGDPVPVIGGRGPPLLAARLLVDRRDRPPLGQQGHRGQDLARRACQVGQDAELGRSQLDRAARFVGQVLVEINAQIADAWRSTPAVKR